MMKNNTPARALPNACLDMIPPYTRPQFHRATAQATFPNTGAGQGCLLVVARDPNLAMHPQRWNRSRPSSSALGTEKWLDQSGSQKIVRTYVFSPNGGYEYTIAICRSSTDCSLVSQESGYARTANGTLSLEPQTESDDGPRAWPYVVGRDPNVGDTQLHFTLTHR